MSAAATFARNAVYAAQGVRIPFALCYHGVGTAAHADPHGLMVPRELFEQHLDVLAERRYDVLTVQALWNRVRSHGDVDGAGAITFDDGLADTLDLVAPILHSRGLTATVCIATGLLGKVHPDLPDGARIVDETQVKELAQVGCEIASHTVDHPDLTILDYQDALDQMRRSKAMLEDLIGRPVLTLAYPFGRYTRATMAAAREAGYECACAAAPVPWEAYSIPRNVVYPGTSPMRLRLQLSGLYGPAYGLSTARGKLRRARRAVRGDR